MKVTLLHATPNAIELLIFTKNTRLKMSPTGLQEISEWPEEKKMKELEYMSTTIPSSWEMVDLIFCIEGVTRAFTHQLVRTRTASYAQQAMRIVDMTNFEYYAGPSIKNNDDKLLENFYDHTMSTINESYQTLIKAGAKPEDARGVLPTNILTNIVMKINLRNFSDLVKKRLTPRVQDEYAEFIQQAMAAVLYEWPWARMFIIPKGYEAHQELSLYLRKCLGKEISETGKSQNETEAWVAMKYLDIIRNEV